MYNVLVSAPNLMAYDLYSINTPSSKFKSTDGKISCSSSDPVMIEMMIDYDAGGDDESNRRLITDVCVAPEINQNNKKKKQLLSTPRIKCGTEIAEIRGRVVYLKCDDDVTKLRTNCYSSFKNKKGQKKNLH